MSHVLLDPGSINHYIPPSWSIIITLGFICFDIKCFLENDYTTFWYNRKSLSNRKASRLNCLYITPNNSNMPLLNFKFLIGHFFQNTLIQKIQKLIKKMVCIIYIYFDKYGCTIFKIRMVQKKYQGKMDTAIIQNFIKQDQKGQVQKIQLHFTSISST